MDIELERESNSYFELKCTTHYPTKSYWIKLYKDSDQIEFPAMCKSIIDMEYFIRELKEQSYKIKSLTGMILNTL